MDRVTLSKFWNEAWTTGLWAASWEKSVQGLTAAQAAKSPAPGRHSIWQITAHIVFWREVALTRARGGGDPSSEDVKRKNFPDVAAATQKAWDECVKQLVSTQQKVAAALIDEKQNLEKLTHLLPHDCYHFGQIGYVRALLGLPPIE